MWILYTIVVGLGYSARLTSTVTSISGKETAPSVLGKLG